MVLNQEKKYLQKRCTSDEAAPAVFGGVFVWFKGTGAVQDNLVTDNDDDNDGVEHGRVSVTGRSVLLSGGQKRTKVAHDFWRVESAMKRGRPGERHQTTHECPTFV